MSKQKSRKIITKKGRKTPYMPKKVRISRKDSKKTKRRRTRSMHKKGGVVGKILYGVGKQMYRLGEMKWGERLINIKLNELKKKWGNFKEIRWERRYSAEEIYFARYGPDIELYGIIDKYDNKIANPEYVERRNILKGDFRGINIEGVLTIKLKNKEDKETENIYNSCYDLINKIFATPHLFWSCDGKPLECSEKKLNIYREVYNITREMINNERWRDFLKRVYHFATKQIDMINNVKTSHYNKGLYKGSDYLSQENLFLCKKTLEEKIIKNIKKIIGEKVATEDEEDQEDGEDEVDEKTLTSEQKLLKKEKDIIEKLQIFDEEEHEFIYDGGEEKYGEALVDSNQKLYVEGLKRFKEKKLVVNELEKALKSKNIDEMESVLSRYQSESPPQPTEYGTQPHHS